MAAIYLMCRVVAIDGDVVFSGDVVPTAILLIGDSSDSKVAYSVVDL